MELNLFYPSTFLFSRALHPMINSFACTCGWDIKMNIQVIWENTQNIHLEKKGKNYRWGTVRTVLWKVTMSLRLLNLWHWRWFFNLNMVIQMMTMQSLSRCQVSQITRMHKCILSRIWHTTVYMLCKCMMHNYCNVTVIYHITNWEGQWHLLT